MADVMTRKPGRVFYGWFALAGGMLIIFTVGGTFVNSFGVFLPVVSAELGWGRATLATALSLGIVAFGLPSPLWGVLVSRLGPRFAIILGNMVAALALAALSQVQQVWQVYILYIIIGLGAGFGGYIACATIANNWFIRRRSLAMGIFIACGGLGGLVFPPLSTALIAAIGWRMSWLVLSGIILGAGVLLGGVVLVRNRPEDMGQVPDGVTGGQSTAADAAAYLEATGKKKTGGRMSQVLKEPAAWLIGAFTSANAFAQGTMSTHQVAYLQDIGFNPMTAATTVSLVAAMMVIGSIAFGGLALRYNVKYLAVIGFVSELVAITVLLTTRELGLIYIYAVFMGIGNGALTAALPTFVGVYFGRERYAQALGVIFPFQVVSQAAAAFIAG
ncbi:MAG TPA: MFS transporter, partial [Dehalococcoidales bacterium]|nr:MFS transporter [Dehalococcoidales bacterium]